MVVVRRNEPSATPGADGRPRDDRVGQAGALDEVGRAVWPISKVGWLGDEGLDPQRLDRLLVPDDPAGSDYGPPAGGGVTAARRHYVPIIEGKARES